MGALTQGQGPFTISRSLIEFRNVKSHSQTARSGVPKESASKIITEDVMVEKKARVSKTENFEFRLENFLVG